MANKETNKEEVAAVDSLARLKGAIVALRRSMEVTGNAIETTSGELKLMISWLSELIDGLNTRAAEPGRKERTDV
jgi:hypothetical protein